MCPYLNNENPTGMPVLGGENQRGILIDTESYG